MRLLSCLSGIAALTVALGLAQPGGTGLGDFESHGDIGQNPKTGSVVFDRAKGEYRITGGGANIWGAEDALHYVWKRVSGDLSLSTELQFEGTGTDPHRKAVLMVRQDLSPGSAYADIAVHGDGLTSLQFRPSSGSPTEEIRSTVSSPRKIRIERRGNQFTISAAKPGEPNFSAGPQTVPLTDPVYVGIGVSSHNAGVLETAVFSNVVLQQQRRYRSKVMILDVGNRTSSQVYQADGVVEAPNWSRDGKYLLLNTGGDLYRLPLTGDGKLDKITLEGGPYRCNNDHDLSFDGKRLAFSASSPSSRQSQVYVANADGTDVQLRTPTAPSYFHGWSPDGKWLAFVGQRNGKFELFRVPAAGGDEERLTSKGGYDDGPEYSPDGKWIYFNSNRSGGWDVWRIPSNGAGSNDEAAEQVTNDELEDWFPHISPDGKSMVFLSFPKDTAGHNEKMPGVSLRLRPVPGNKVTPAAMETLTTFFGGQGTINVNSWSPDSKRLAFIIFEPVREE